MKLLIIFLFILISKAIALEAVVTVLETPLLSSPQYTAPVVQYLRKGDVIKIHPSVANDREMDKYAPPEANLLYLKQKLKETPEYKQDPMFRGEEANTAYMEDEFIPTLDRQGNTVYVISSHIYIYFNDKRELRQKITAEDPTDYRLEEPLPKNYPLKTESGFRGQFLLGITQPSYESYDYNASFKTKGYESPLDLSYTLLKQAPGNYQERFFIGGTLAFRHFKNMYSFGNQRLAREEIFRLGAGPTVSYDAFKGEKDRINLSGTIIVNFFDRNYINQLSEAILAEEEREFQGFSVAPRVAIQYHRKQIVEDIDFVLGTMMEIGTPTTYRAKNAGKEPLFWRDLGNDKFTTRTTFTLGGYIGLQSAY